MHGALRTMHVSQQCLHIEELSTNALKGTMATYQLSKFEWNGDIVSGKPSQSYFEAFTQSPKQLLSELVALEKIWDNFRQVQKDKAYPSFTNSYKST